MRKGFVLAAVIVMLVLPISAAAEGPRMVISFALPNLSTIIPGLGLVTYNKEGNISGAIGINLAIGVSARFFFYGIYPNRFNGYWGLGTFAFIFPYVEIGANYASLGAGGDQYLSIDIGVFSPLLFGLGGILPYVGLSIYF